LNPFGPRHKVFLHLLAVRLALAMKTPCQDHILQQNEDVTNTNKKGEGDAKYEIQAKLTLTAW
jgi:hypothetical protein